MVPDAIFTRTFCVSSESVCLPPSLRMLFVVISKAETVEPELFFPIMLISSTDVSEFVSPFRSFSLSKFKPLPTRLGQGN